MNTDLTPTYQRLFGDHWVLWYKASNSYSVIDKSFKKVLDFYLKSDTLAVFEHRLLKEDPTSDLKTVVQTLVTYLENCNSFPVAAKNTLEDFDASHRHIEKHYAIKGKIVKVYFDSELVSKTIHPALAYLSLESPAPCDITFDVYIKAKQLYLFKNKKLICCVPQQEYHRLQGKFNMHLLCFLHDKTEMDWIGTFHGSTITDGESSLLIIGASGKGKSTLCAILAAHNFSLVADDLSPMLSGTQSIYYNPSAISIKEGAFSLLSPLVKGFDNLPIVQFNKSKGLIKYMPCTPPLENAYPCKGLILVNYQAKAAIKLETVSIKTLLETLIPDSWLSPNPGHAKEFLDWLSTVKCYQLTYSDSKSVSLELSQLFQLLNTNE